ncbi:tryptophan--tRNA ligase [Candidatus Atribacteria bacterium MT.SAG.1]|nr:tryptophan--tRNA ligase [Candidatus Atribacteria bacterium MT.SAG.1]
MKKNKRKRILTGDRPTGPLHLGHFVGSLQSRIKLQNSCEQFVMLADTQALTDNADNPEKIKKAILQVAIDYLSVGIDPKKTTIFIQSAIPELAELNLYFLNLVTLARLQRNPTIKDEMKQKRYGANVPIGFLTYPISQAADITIFKADLVPVGADQLPILEQVNEIVRKFNKTYGKGKKILVECKGFFSKTSRLPGIDGKGKASKSLDNAIFLSDSKKEVARKVMSMYTDPKHIRVQDPGRIKGNVVFDYLDAFDTDIEELKKIKAHYQKGGLGDVEVKKRLIKVLEKLLAPIRARRKKLEKNPKMVMKILAQGTKKARKIAQETMKQVRKAMQIDYF